MKKKNVLILLAATAYCLLFYKQSPGMNQFIFTLVLIPLLWLTDRSLSRSKVWLVVAGTALLTSAGSLLYGTLLSQLANILSLGMLASLSYNRDSSLIFTLAHGIYSWVILPFSLFKRKAENTEDPEGRSGFSLNKFLKIFLPLLVAFIFFQFYKAASPDFGKLMDYLFYHLLSFDFLWFMCCGLLMCYVLFNQQLIRQLFLKDQAASNQLTPGIRTDEMNIFNNLQSEHSAALLMFTILNALLLLVNALDIKAFFAPARHWDAEAHSQAVHLGINVLIFSIVVAILLTLYFFRGNLNFIAKHRTLKLLAIAWMAQNIVLVFGCAVKNLHYVQEFGLTYKRIGVFIYLLLTLIGLTTTLLKLIQVKSNWYLLRKNAWAFFGVLVISSLVHWDRIIVRYNLYYAQVAEPTYLMEFSNESLPYLLQTDLEKFDAEWHYGGFELWYSSQRQWRKNHFLRNFEDRSWLSWNLADQHTYDQLQLSSDPGRN
jgi:hypothetical protein